MAEFVEVQFTTEVDALVDEAIDRLVETIEAKGVTGYTPAEGNLEVILLSVIGPMAANAALIASVVPPAIFRAYGTKLLKLAYNEGARATAKTKWTVTPEPVVRAIPEGTTIEAGGRAFYVEIETEVPEGSSSVELQVRAAESGTEYNQIEGVAEQTNPISWVLAVEIIGESSGGADQESDEEYADRLAEALTLQAPRPITAKDYGKFVLGVPSSILPAGIKVGRATAIDGYNPATHKLTATVTLNSATMKEISSFVGITAGAEGRATEVKGVGIPGGTTVLSVNEGAKELTMSAKATATHAGEEIQAIGSYGNERTVTTFVTNAEGKALEAVKTVAIEAIEGWLEEYRELNFLTYVRNASYEGNKIYITAKVRVLSNYEAGAVEANIKAALVGAVNPATWNGLPGLASVGVWENYKPSLVRYNTIIGLIESVPGVAFVFPGAEGLKIGTSAGPLETSDIALVGPAPLPEVTNATITLSTG